MKTFRPVLLLLSVFCFSFTSMLYAQSTIWQKSLGGDGIDEGRMVRETKDDSGKANGYIAAGFSNSTDTNKNNGGYDAFLAKLDFNGDVDGKIFGQKLFGGSGDDYAQDVWQTKNASGLYDGYIFAGYSNSTDLDKTPNHGDGTTYDGWVVKLRPDGSVEWQKLFGGSGDDYLQSVQQTNDGGYILAGYSNSTDITNTPNHGDGSTYSYDAWIIKLSSKGDIEWQELLGGSSMDRAYSIQQTKNTNGDYDGYIVVGLARSTDGDVTGHHSSSDYDDYWVIKLYLSGSIDWNKCLGGNGEDGGRPSIQQTSDGGYIVAGATVSLDGDVEIRPRNSDFDYWIVKLDPCGSIEWSKSLGGGEYSVDYAQSVTEASDGGYVVVGWSDAKVAGSKGFVDYWIVKLDHTGQNIEWDKRMGGNSMDYPYSIQRTSDDGYIIAGYSQSVDGDLKGNPLVGDCFWVVKLDSKITGINGPVNKDTFTVYMDPTNRYISIEARNLSEANVIIANALEQVVYRAKLDDNNKNIDLSKYSQGIYFVSIYGKDKNTGKDFKATKPVILQ